MLDRCTSVRVQLLHMQKKTQDGDKSTQTLIASGEKWDRSQVVYTHWSCCMKITAQKKWWQEKQERSCLHNTHWQRTYNATYTAMYVCMYVCICALNVYTRTFASLHHWWPMHIRCRDRPDVCNLCMSNCPRVLFEHRGFSAGPFTATDAARWSVHKTKGIGKSPLSICTCRTAANTTRKQDKKETQHGGNAKSHRKFECE